jgi:hypothetical protein
MLPAPDPLQYIYEPLSKYILELPDQIKLDMFLVHTGHKLLINFGGLGPHDSSAKKISCMQMLLLTSTEADK